MTRLAAVDIGTNSTRLLVADVVASGDANGARGATPARGVLTEVVEIERAMTITRLGQGVDTTGALDGAAMERTLAVLEQYAASIGDTPVRIAATSACRDAANRDEFFDRVEAILGKRPELLSGDEEARTGFAGATAGMEPGSYLVADIGGGSTELSLGQVDQETDAISITGAVSLNIGCVRLSERYLHSDPPTPEEVADALAASDAMLATADELAGELAGERASPGRLPSFVGVAGTVTTLAALFLELDGYHPELTHHVRLGRNWIFEELTSLASMTAGERRTLPAVEAGRADVIVGGTAILLAIMRHFELDEVIVSESDILDGLVLSQVGRA